MTSREAAIVSAYTSASTLVQRLRYVADVGLMLDAADEIERLTARVAELEACLADVVNQLEIGGVK